MLVQRAVLSGELPSSLKQDIKGITDSPSACLAHHNITAVPVVPPLVVLAPQVQVVQRKAIVIVIAESSQWRRSTAKEGHIAVAERSPRRRGYRSKRKGRKSPSLRAASGGGVPKKSAGLSLKADSGGSACVSAALACRHSTQTPSEGV
jgi:hypothetical protein